MRRKNKRAKLVALIFSLLLIGIGYAYLSANLKINGTAKISNAKWDVHFENAKVDEKSDTVTFDSNSNSNLAQGIPVIKGENNTELEWNVTLNQPGDYYTFSADIVNDGDFDAKVDLDNSYFKIKIGEEEKTLSIIEFYNEIFDYDNSNRIIPEYLLTYMIMPSEYLPSGQFEELNGYIKIDDKKISNDEWEALRGKEIKMILNLNYVQTDDVPPYTNNLNVSLENPVVTGVGSTTTFPNDVNVPTIVNKISSTKTLHEVSFDVVFNNPGDYYDLSIDAINHENNKMELDSITRIIKIGDSDEIVTKSIDLDDFVEKLPNGLLYDEEHESDYFPYYYYLSRLETEKMNIHLGVDSNISEFDFEKIQGKNINIKYIIIYKEYIYNSVTR